MDFFRIIRTVTAAYLEVRDLPQLPAEPYEPEMGGSDEHDDIGARKPLDEHVAADNRERAAAMRGAR